MKISDVAFCITTFARLDKLSNLVNSIYLYYPYATIYIADNGFIDLEKLSYYGELEKKGCKIYLLDFDVGLSCCRNYLVSHTTEPYILILEDDFVFNCDTKIELLLDCLNLHFGIHLIGGVCKDPDGTPEKYEGDIDLTDGVLTYLSANEDIWYEEFDGKFRWKFVDRVFNFFLAKREIFDVVKWRDDLKICEHIPFFIDLKYNSCFKCAFTDSVSLVHDKLNNTPDLKYMKYRNRVNEFTNLFKSMYNIKQIRHKYLRVDSKDRVLQNKLKDLNKESIT